MWKLCQQKSSKMKVSLQENCSLNQNKSTALNRPRSQEFDNSTNYSLPHGTQYKSSSLPPPPPPPPTRTTKEILPSSKTNNRFGPASSVSNIMSAGDDSCAINELLEGRMYLTVILPTDLLKGTKGSVQDNKIVINVERRAPMMDILVNIATQYKFNASKYRISVDGYNFQASTPIGSLDVNTISIIPKPLKHSFRSTEMNLPQSMPSSIIYSVSSKQKSATLSTPPSVSVNSSDNHPVNLNFNQSTNHQGPTLISNVPFKTTFRLQVNLPRNQLMVLRVSGETRIAQIKSKICSEKELDPSKYHLMATKGSEMSILDPVKCLSDYGVHEVTLMSTNHLPKVQMSQSAAHHHHHLNKVTENQQDHKNTNERVTHHNEGRSTKVVKKRPAPLPPSKILNAAAGSTQTVIKTESVECEENINNSSSNIHLRQDSGSDSSGYYESMISSESHKSSTGAIYQPKSQNKISDKENSKKGIIRKRKAPLPPDWKDNKSEIGESIKCSSDFGALSSSSESSGQCDYRIVSGKDHSNDRASPPEDESSFTLVSGSDDLEDIETLKGSDITSIPSPDSGTCSHVPLDEEKSSDGIASASGSAIMSDSTVGDTIIEEAETELEEQESFNHDNKRRAMRPLSYASTSSLHSYEIDRKPIKSFSPPIDGIPETDAKMSIQYTNDLKISSNPTFNHHHNQLTLEDTNISFLSLPHENQHISEYDNVEMITGPKSIEKMNSCSNERQSAILIPDSIDGPSNQLNLNESNVKPINLKASNEFDLDKCKELKEKEVAFTLPIPVEAVLVESNTKGKDARVNDEKEFKKSTTALDVNQKEGPSIETTRTPTCVSETIVNRENRELNCDNTGNDQVEEEKVKEREKERDNSLFGQDVKTRSQELDHNDSQDNDKDKDKRGKLDGNNDCTKDDNGGGDGDDDENDDDMSSRFVRDLCRPRVRLTNFKIGSYKEIDNLDIYQSNNNNSGSGRDSGVGGGLKERPKSLDVVKPVIVTAAFKNVNSSACNEFGHNNNITKSNSSNNRISIITPQPYKLNRLASWSGTDTKSFRQAYSNVSNCIKDRETIAEKAEKIEKVLKRGSINRNMDNNKLFNLKQHNENTSISPVFKGPPPPPPPPPPANESQIVSGPSSSLTGHHRCVSQIEINGDPSKVFIRQSIKGINCNNNESPIQVTTFLKSEQPEPSDYKKPNNQATELNHDRLGKQNHSNETSTKLEIINTVKPLSKAMLTRMEPINFNKLAAKSAEPKTSDCKVPLPILPSTNSHLLVTPPPPPPPPPMPKMSLIPSKLNVTLPVHRSKTSNDQVNGREKQFMKSVPKFKKSTPCVIGSSVTKVDFHDALLNEIRACGGRKALRKVNINR